MQYTVQSCPTKLSRSPYFATSVYNNEEDGSHYNIFGSYWFTNIIAGYLKDIDGTLGAFIDSNQIMDMDTLVDTIETEYEQWLVDMGKN